MSIVNVSAAALVDKNGRVLVAKRPAGKHMAGLWEFPGGKIEESESPEQCLVRELKEELNIKVTRKDLTPISFVSHKYDSFQLIMLLYGCTRWYGTPKAIEHSDIKWTDAAGLSHLSMPPADAPLLAPLTRFMREL